MPSGDRWRSDVLHALASAVLAEGFAPVAASTRRAAHFGPAALSRHIAIRLRRLGAKAVVVAQAVTVLQDQATPSTVARLTGLGVDEVAAARQELEHAGVLRCGRDVERNGSTVSLRFVHPVVEAAVYQLQEPSNRFAAHRRAAELAEQDRCTPERVAAHLLELPPAGDAHVVEVLRVAEATGRLAVPCADGAGWRRFSVGSADCG